MHPDEINDEFEKVANKLIEKGELGTIYDAIPSNVKLELIEDCKEIINKPSILTSKDYYKIAYTTGLGYHHRAVYIKFMLEAFPTERDTRYATEWANRFLSGTHWGCADKNKKPILREAYGVDK